MTCKRYGRKFLAKFSPVRNLNMKSSFITEQLIELLFQSTVVIG